MNNKKQTEELYKKHLGPFTVEAGNLTPQCKKFGVYKNKIQLDLRETVQRPTLDLLCKDPCNEGEISNCSIRGNNDPTK